MFNFLAETGAETGGDGYNWTQWILPAVLLLGIILVFVMNHFRSKKDNERAQNMAEAFKPGDRIRTGHGIYGKIIEINETTYGKVVLLETGDDFHKGYIMVDLVAIAGMDEKKAIIYDLEGNPIVEGEEPVAAEGTAVALPEGSVAAKPDDIIAAETESAKAEVAKPQKKQANTVEEKPKAPANKKKK